MEGLISGKDMEVDVEGYLIKAYLAGKSGAGKTQSSITLPGRKLLIDLDGRAQTVAGRDDVWVKTITEPDPRSPRAWNELLKFQKEVVKAVREDDFPFEGIIYDGLTAMGRMSMNWALLLDSKRGLGGAPAQQHYLPQMDALAKFVLASLTLPKHIVYTGHIELHEEQETGRQVYYPKITGKLRTELPNWFNETYFCYRAKDKDGRIEYRWMTAGEGRYDFFKSSLNNLGAFWEDPIVLDFGKERVGFADLLGRRFGKEERKKGKEVMEGKGKKEKKMAGTKL